MSPTTHPLVTARGEVEVSVRAMLTHSRTRVRSIVATALVLSTTVACSAATEPHDDAWRWERPCPQTYEFGNHGCARIIVLATFADTLWPDTLRIVVRAADSVMTLGVVEGQFGGPAQRALRMQLTDYWGWQRLSASDSLELSGLVDARVLRGYVDSALPPILATARQAFAPRFTRVGQRPPVDTVRLHFSRE